MGGNWVQKRCNPRLCHTHIFDDVITLPYLMVSKCSFALLFLFCFGLFFFFNFFFEGGGVIHRTSFTWNYENVKRFSRMTHTAIIVLKHCFIIGDVIICILRNKEMFWKVNLWFLLKIKRNILGKTHCDQH